jgi:hypothetical protein
MMSFLLVIFLGTPVIFEVTENDFKNNLATETSGWIQFWIFYIAPMVSSIWNPLVFLSLTPKSRALFLSLLTRRGGFCVIKAVVPEG